MTLGVIVICRILVRLQNQIKLEWDPSWQGAHRHRRADGTGACPQQQSLSFVCPCDPCSAARNWYPLDGHFQIIAPPSMLGTWYKEAEKHIKRTGYLAGLTVVMAHADVRKEYKLPDVHQVASELRAETRYTSNKQLDHRGIEVQVDPWRDIRYYPQKNSSRFIVITSFQSWLGNVKRPLKSTYNYSTGSEGKWGHRNTADHYPVAPGMVIIDEAHLCQDRQAGHYKILEQIDNECASKPRRLFLTGTPLSKSPADLGAMLYLLSCPEWNQTDHPLHYLCPSKIDEATKVFNNITTANDSKLAIIAENIWTALFNVLISRNSYSDWFGVHIKPPIVRYDFAFDCPFPSAYITDFASFETQIRVNLQKNKSVEGMVSTSQVRSVTRLYRIASSLPFVTRLWSQRSVKEPDVLLSEDIVACLAPPSQQDLLSDEQFTLVKYLDTIFSTSPKLEKIGHLLEQWTPAEGKMLVVSEFLVVSLMVHLVSILDSVQHYLSGLVYQ